MRNSREPPQLFFFFSELDDTFGSVSLINKCYDLKKMTENLQSVLYSSPLSDHLLCLLSVLPFSHTGCAFYFILSFFGLT